MSNKVVISRIQNRRGSQVQFNGIEWTSTGPNSIYPKDLPPRVFYGDPDWAIFTQSNYPNVLLPGEIGFCLDTGNCYIGLENGGYDLITGSDNKNYNPLVLSLPPSDSFVPIPELTFSSTPFLNIYYSITDSQDLSPDSNSTGVSFSSNGTLTITSISGS